MNMNRKSFRKGQKYFYSTGSNFDEKTKKWIAFRVRKPLPHPTGKGFLVAASNRVDDWMKISVFDPLVPARKAPDGTVKLAKPDAQFTRLLREHNGDIREKWVKEDFRRSLQEAWEMIVYDHLLGKRARLRATTATAIAITLRRRRGRQRVTRGWARGR